MQNYAPNESLMQEGITVREWRDRYSRNCSLRKIPAPVSEYASYIYDAVWTYALALDRLLTHNHSLAADFHTEHTTE